MSNENGFELIFKCVGIPEKEFPVRIISKSQFVSGGVFDELQLNIAEVSDWAEACNPNGGRLTDLEKGIPPEAIERIGKQIISKHVIM